MRDHEAAMCAYAQLAELSHAKRQSPARDRFLLLAGVEACRAGWPAVAAACHTQLLATNSALQVTRFDSFPAALQDEEFRGIAAHWERWCPFERAEHLLTDLGLPARLEPGAELLDAVVIARLAALSG